MARETGRAYGSNLTPVFGTAIREYSKAWYTFYQLLDGDDVLDGTSGKNLLGHKVFTKAGVPTAKAKDDPGSDYCLIVDTTNHNWYFVHSRAASSAITTSFTVVKIAGA